MTDDYMVVFGCLAVLASLPGLLNAYSGGRSPGVWAVLLIAGVACVTVVLVTNPTTYHVFNRNRSTLMAENCYWGPCGLGGMPNVSNSGSVDISPWLTAAPGAKSGIEENENGTQNTEHGKKQPVDAKVSFHAHSCKHAHMHVS